MEQTNGNKVTEADVDGNKAMQGWTIMHSAAPVLY